MTRAQLLGLGLSARTIGYRVQTGKLIVVHAGVYAVGHRRPVVRASYPGLMDFLANSERFLTGGWSY